MFITMASPFNIGGQGNAQGVGPGIFGTSAQHGTAEQGRGIFSQARLVVGSE